MNFSRLTLTAKLAAINVLLAAALLAVVAVAWRQLPSEDEAAEAAQLARAQRATQNADMMHDALHSDVLGALLADPQAADQRAKVLQSVRSNAREFRAELAALATMALGPALKPSLDAAHDLGHAYVEGAEDMVKLALVDRATAVAANRAFDVLFEDTKTALAAQTAKIAESLDAANAGAKHATQAARRWLLVAALVTVVTGWLGVALIARSIRRSLMGLRDVAREVAAGNLERRSDLSGHDEVGQLAASVNQMADTLHQMIEHMRSDAQRSAFAARLGAALDMADSEAQALAVVARALDEISPTHGMALLLADSSDAHLESAAQVRHAGCSVDSTFACVAVRRGHAVSFPTSEALDACPKLRGRPEGAMSAACVPVTFMGRALGVLHACGPVDQPLTPAATEHLAVLGAQAGSRIGTVRAFARTQLQASTDALTGLANRRSVEARLHELMASRTPFAVVMADLDRFKNLNDTHGHPAGDEALRAFADVVRENMRQQDMAGRWGGEEFAFVLTQVDAEHALQWADRLRACLAAALPHRSTPLFTASFGIAHSQLEATPEALVAAADRALYAAKSQGRDRAVLAVAEAGLPALTRRSEPAAAVDMQRLSASA